MAAQRAPKNLTVAIQLKADGSGLVGDLKLSKAQLDQLESAAIKGGKAVAGAGDKIEDAGKKSGKAAGRFDALSKQASKLSRGFSSLQGIVASIGFAFIANDAVQTIARFQDLDTRIQTLVGSEEKLLEVQNFLIATSREQSQTLAPLTERYADLLGLVDAGILKFQESQVILKGTNDLMAATGATTDQLGLTMFGLAQALTTGIVRAEEFNQVTEPVPGLLAKMEKAAGLASGQLRQLVNDGRLTSDMFRQVFVAALKEYEGAAVATAENIGPTYRRMQNAYVELLRALEKPVAAALIPVLEGTTTAIKAISPTLVTLANNMDAVALAATGVIAAKALGPILLSAGQGALAFAGGLGTVNVALLLTQARLTAMTVATRAATGALALLGGPGGMLILGATALGVYALTTERGMLATDAARVANEKLRAELAKGTEVTKASAAATLERARADLQAAQAAVTAALAIREKLQAQLSDPLSFGQGQRADTQSGLDQRTKQIAALSREIGEMEGGIIALEKRLDALGGAAGGAGEGLDKAGGAAKELDAATKALQEQMKKLVDGMGKKKEGTQKLTKEEKEFNKALAEAKRLYEETRTPLEAYNDEVDRLAKLYASGAFKDVGGIDLVFRGVAQAKKELAEANAEAQKLTTQAGPLTKAWDQATQDINQALADGLVNGFKDTGDAIKQIFKRLLSDLIQMAFQNKLLINVGLGATGAGLANQAGNLVAGGGGGGIGIPGIPGNPLNYLSNLSSGLTTLGNAIAPYTALGAAPAGSTLSASGAAGLGGAALGGLGGGLYGYQQGGVRGAALGTGIGIAAGGFAGGALAGAGGGLAGVAAGGLAGAGASLAAIPVWGWAALAALAVFGSGKKTPHPWATAVAGELPAGTVNASGDTFRSGTQGQNVLTGASGLGFGLDFKHLGESDAAQFQTALLGLDEALTKLHPSVDLAGEALGRFGVTAEGYVAGVENGSERMVETVGEVTAHFVKDWLRVADVLDETTTTLIMAMDGTGEEILAAAAAFQVLDAYANADVVTDAATAVRLANQTLFDVFQAQRTVAFDLARTYDGTAASTVALANATQTLYQLQINLLGQIEQARGRVAASFEATRENLILEQLDLKERYDRLLNQANAQLDTVRSSSDPAAIEAAGNKALELFNRGIGELTAEQRAAMMPEIMNFLDEAEALTNERLQAVADVIKQDSENLKTAIKDAMLGAASEIRAAAAEIRAGAEAIPDTINVNSTVTVRNETPDDSGWRIGYADR